MGAPILRFIPIREAHSGAVHTFTAAESDWWEVGQAMGPEKEPVPAAVEVWGAV